MLPVTSQGIRKHLRDHGVGAGVAPDFVTKRDSELVGIRDGAPPTPSVPRLANGRCAATRGPRLAFTSARVSRAWCRGWLCPEGSCPGDAGEAAALVLAIQEFVVTVEGTVMSASRECCTARAEGQPCLVRFRNSSFGQPDSVEPGPGVVRGTARCSVHLIGVMAT